MICKFEIATLLSLWKCELMIRNQFCILNIKLHIGNWSLNLIVNLYVKAFCHSLELVYEPVLEISNPKSDVWVHDLVQSPMSESMA